MNILITRPSPEGEELVNKLLNIGKIAYHLPLIYFSSGKTLSCIHKQLYSLNTGDFLFMVSKHAVKYAHIQLLNTKSSWPTHIKYYSIGQKTSLQMYTLSGIAPKYPQTKENSENLLKFPEFKNDISNRQALILKGNNGRSLIKNTLQKRGVSVSCCECYTRKLFKYNKKEKYKHILNLNITDIVVTTKEILNQLYYFIPNEHRNYWLITCRLIVISSRLKTIAQKLGWKNIIVIESASNTTIFNALTTNTQHKTNHFNKK